MAPKYSWGCKLSKPFFGALLKAGLALIAASSLAAQAQEQWLMKPELASASVNGSVVQTAQVRAELLALAPEGFVSGKPIWAGLQLSPLAQWHTYWKNPGDSGLPTTLEWSLPAGVSAGAITWPTPQRLPVANMANYAYESSVLLAVPITLTKAAQELAAATGHLELKLTAKWLVCKLECLPQEGNFSLKLPLNTVWAKDRIAFETSKAQSPKALNGQATSVVLNGGLALNITGLPPAWRGQALQLFPENSDLLGTGGMPQLDDKVAREAVKARTGTQVWTANTWHAYLPNTAPNISDKSTLPFVLALGGTSFRAVASVASVSSALPPAQTPAAAALKNESGPAIVESNSANFDVVANAVSTAVSAGNLIEAPATAPATLRPTGATFGLALALLGALLGGLILNLMPCVLPVLALKVFSILQHERGPSARSSRIAQGFAYTVGIVGSFTALGALLIALRAAGEQLGWGFHLQSPAVVAALAGLFTLLSLNLLGVFEVGNVLPSSWASWQARQPVVNSFFTGVLTVAVAAPCTAPFMGASLGYALGLPALEALSIFAALGLGLAAPFLLISVSPSMGTWLPRPGVWMVNFRHFLAFPMLATVVWLAWVFGQLTSLDGLGALLMVLLSVSALAWALRLSGRSRSVFGCLALAGLLGVISVIGPGLQKELARSGLEERSAPSSAAQAGPDAVWQPWAEQKVASELAKGHPVFVDFTAAWCITCQYNKKTTLANEAVLADFRANNVSLLRADWTRRDPEITKALTQLGRSGVPVYVLYQQGRAPTVFTEVLQVSELQAALAAIKK